MLAPAGPQTWHRLVLPLPRNCLLSARWLVGLTLLTSISVLQSDAPAAVIWPAGWSSRTVSRVHGAARSSPNDAAKWSNISREPNEKCCQYGGPIQMCHSWVQGRERERKMQPNLNSGTMCPVCIKPILKLHLWLSCSWAQETFVILLHEVWNLPCWPWECQAFLCSSSQSSFHEATFKRKTPNHQTVIFFLASLER